MEYELQKVVQEQNALFSNILQVFADNGLPGIEQAERLIKPTGYSLRAKAISALQQRWIRLPLPYCSLEECYAIIEAYKQMKWQRHMLKEKDRNFIYYAQEVNKDSPRIVTLNRSDQIPEGAAFMLQPDISSLHVQPFLNNELSSYTPQKLLVYKGQVIKFIEPSTLELQDQPVNYVHPIQLENFTEAICYFPTTKVCNLQMSLNRILDKGIESGLNRHQFAELFKLFISQEFPSYLFTCQSLNSPNEVFNAAIAILESHDMMTSINSNLQNVTRQTSDPVAVTYYHYKSLISLKIQYQQPGLTESQLKAKAERLSLSAIEMFLAVPAVSEYQAWTKRRHLNGETITENQALQYLSHLESSHPKYKITTPMSTNNDHKNVDLYNTQVSTLTSTRRQANQDKDYKHQALTDFRKSRKQPSHERGRSRSHSGSRSQDFRRSTNDTPRSHGRRETGARPKSPAAHQRSSGRPQYSRSPSPRYQSRSSYRSSSAPRYSRSRTPSRPSSRQSSRSPSTRYSQAATLETQIDNLSKQLQQLNHKSTFCLKCEKINHSTSQCRLYKKLAKFKCNICGKGRHMANICRSKSSK